MKLNQEEILKIAKNIKLDINKDEMDEIIDSIALITSSLDEIVDTEVSNDPKIMGNEKLSNVFASDINDAPSPEIMLDKCNNIDGKYFKIEVSSGVDDES